MQHQQSIDNDRASKANSSFALYVRKRSHELNINLSEIVRRAGISRQALYNLMDGKSEQARISTVLALSHVLQTHPLAIFRLLLVTTSKLPNTEAKYKWDATGFVRDVTIPDNTLVMAGLVFLKQWEIQNTGLVPWIKRRLICVDSRPQTFGELSNDCGLGGRCLLTPTCNAIDIPDRQPGDSVILGVEFTAPLYPCSVLSYWKMADEHGELCFPEQRGLSCQVTVVAL